VRHTTGGELAGHDVGKAPVGMVESDQTVGRSSPRRWTSVSCVPTPKRGEPLLSPSSARAAQRAG
jgi:hypothetical protein